ncbi:cyclase [Streptomyces sp. MNU77]|uniref:cyclase family protein n=1 Tax=Streptomyces sp. MNU77 TaxID=1573406 RepID=UPI0005DC773F|nr:cyclase family protein [Streptomyces sp. MNU77]OLO25810.1 cyclase [Streptomyces sp. MNU77]
MPASLNDFRRVADKVRNWNRWGPEDQLGTLNLITDEKVRQAAALVRRGAVFPLGAKFEADGVWPGNYFRRNPVHLMTVDGGDGAEFARHLGEWSGAGPQEEDVVGMWGSTISRFNDDWITMPLQCSTQWDALSHMYYDDLLYNGYPASSVTSLGATRDSIDQVHVKGVVSRGVLLDVARHRGERHLRRSTAVGGAELTAVADAQNVSVGPGDIVLVRTGWLGMLSEIGDGDEWRAGCPGVSWDAATWLHERGVAALAADNVAVEPQAVEVAGVSLPLHLLCLRDMGLMFGELWELDALAADCAADGVYDFQLVAPPLRITGAVGTPLNPVAMK